VEAGSGAEAKPRGFAVVNVREPIIVRAGEAFIAVPE
jgi:hypothetical protein